MHVKIINFNLVDMTEDGYHGGLRPAGAGIRADSRPSGQGLARRPGNQYLRWRLLLRRPRRGRRVRRVRAVSDRGHVPELHQHHGSRLRRRRGEHAPHPAGHRGRRAGRRGRLTRRRHRPSPLRLREGAAGHVSHTGRPASSGNSTMGRTGPRATGGWRCATSVHRPGKRGTMGEERGAETACSSHCHSRSVPSESLPKLLGSRVRAPSSALRFPLVVAVFRSC